MTEVVLESTIVGVTVYPDRARVTRRGRLTLPAGEHTVRIGPLPLGVHQDSLRVAGRGPATVLGVDVVTRRQPVSTDAAVQELTEQRRALDARMAELRDDDQVETQRLDFLNRLAQRAGSTFAHAVARAEADHTNVAGFVDGIADQIAAAKARRRTIVTGREEIERERSALDRRLADLSGSRQPDQLVAQIPIAVGATDPVEAAAGAADPVEAAAGAAAPGEAGHEIELELSYVVTGASWQSAYDLRLVDQTLTVSWFGLVTQRTGEDWPQCELQLSTARPSGAVTVPELEPWFLDRVRPLPVAQPMALSAAAPGAAGAVPPPAAAPMQVGGGGADRARSAAKRKVAESVATVEQGVAAATYRPVRAVAVLADGTAHRTTVAVFDLDAQVDYVTAPVRTTDVHLRATVRNTSPHTLLPGAAAVFHGGDFVAGTRLAMWAPGEELDLALGLDDRVRVERELIRRNATKATLGSTRRTEVEYRITVANHTPRPATVTVLDQLPVSRDEAITVRELRLEPVPAERTELGELTWKLRLEPAQSGVIQLGWRVEVGKGVELAGWRE